MFVWAWGLTKLLPAIVFPVLLNIMGQCLYSAEESFTVLSDLALLSVCFLPLSLQYENRRVGSTKTAAVFVMFIVPPASRDLQ